MCVLLVSSKKKPKQSKKQQRQNLKKRKNGKSPQHRQATGEFVACRSLSRLWETMFFRDHRPLPACSQQRPLLPSFQPVPVQPSSLFSLPPIIPVMVSSPIQFQSAPPEQFSSAQQLLPATLPLPLHIPTFLSLLSPLLLGPPSSQLLAQAAN